MTELKLKVENGMCSWDNMG